MNGEKERGESGVKEREQKRKWWTMTRNERGWVKQRDKVLLKCCRGLMAHFPDTSLTLFGSRTKRGWLVNHRGNGWDNGHRCDIELLNTCPYWSQSSFHCVGQEPSATQNHFNNLTVSTPRNYRRWHTDSVHMRGSVCAGVSIFMRTNDVGWEYWCSLTEMGSAAASLLIKAQRILT